MNDNASCTDRAETRARSDMQVHSITGTECSSRSSIVVLLGVDVIGVRHERPPRQALVLVAGALAPAFRRRVLRAQHTAGESDVNNLHLNFEADEREADGIYLVMMRRVDRTGRRLRRTRPGGPDQGRRRRREKQHGQRRREHHHRSPCHG